MGSAIGWLVAHGLSDRVARWVAIAALFALLLGTMGTLKCRYDRDLVARHDAAREARIVPRLNRASEAAAEARAADTIVIARQLEENHDAIAAAPDGAPSAAAVAMACQRLRRAGADVARHPACRGHSGGD